VIQSKRSGAGRIGRNLLTFARKAHERVPVDVKRRDPADLSLTSYD